MSDFLEKSTAEVLRDRKDTGRRLGLRLMLIPLVILGAIVATVVIVAVLFEQQYATRIYPGISIGDFYVGEMARAEAEAKVQEHYDRMLAVFDYQSTKWFAPWPLLGVRANGREAVQQAFNIARDGNIDQRITAWQARQPVVLTFSYDASLTRKILEQHRADVSIAPRSATITIADGAAAVTPGVPGIELDTDATLQDAFARFLLEQPVTVYTRPVAPAPNGAEAAVTQLNTWLQRPFALTMWWDNHMITRAIAPSERMGWVAVQNSEGSLTPALVTEGIRETLLRVNAELGPDAAMRLDEATRMVQRGFETGAPQTWFVVPHGDIVYSIQRGDTYESIGDTYGIPTARLLDANPDIWDEGRFAVGTQITVPTQNTMLPVPISPTNQQRIEVDLTHQRLQAFDGGEVVLSTSISSGIPKWRTLIGVFQVQEKVDDAVNKLAHITMPDWLSIYDIGDPGNSLTNGIHALPELGGGRRLWAGYLGRPVSFGCVVMGIDEAAWLYTWVQLGTPVLIYGVTPPTDLNYDDLIEAQQKTQAKAP